ncbi:unnamed protein product [Chrysoparadoxa australica]
MTLPGRNDAESEGAPAAGGVGDTARDAKHTWVPIKVADAQAWHSGDSLSRMRALENAGQRTQAASDGSVFQMADQATQNAFRADISPRMRTGSKALSTSSLAAMEQEDRPSPRQSRTSGDGQPNPLIMRCASLASGLRIGTDLHQDGDFQQKISQAAGHGMSFAQFAVREEGKVVLAMVGLPARGKTFIARTIRQHMNWFGVRTEIYNAGNFRRKVVGANTPASFFDPQNKEGASMREKCAALALEEALKDLSKTDEKDGTYIAIFDATNTTKERRVWLKQQVKEHPGNFQLVFLETVVTNDKDVWDTVKEVKMKSPDYEDMNEDAAMKDFMERIAKYKAVYEPIERSEGVPFVRITNAGEELLVSGTKGFCMSRIVSLVARLRLSLRPILLTRCGESTDETKGIMGRDPQLTPVGHMYATALGEALRERARLDPNYKPVIWTSCKLRSRQMVADLHADFPVLVLPDLDEIDAGFASGLTIAEYEDRFPDVKDAREMDKLRTKLPGGESYQDVFNRLEPLLLELLAEPRPVVIVAHHGVLRVLYGYLNAVPPEKSPHLHIPLHQAILLQPHGYGYDEWRLAPQCK